MVKEVIKRELKRHVIDSTAIVTLANPLYATIETMIAGMSNEVSVTTRGLNTIITYAFLGSATKIRDYSKNIFNITSNSKERIKGLHDIIFAGIFIAGIKPITYVLAGETDWKKIAWATGLSLAAGGVFAYPMGYLVDCYRELFNIEDNNRLPKFIKEQSSSFKKKAGVALTATSIGAVGLIYTLNDYLQMYV